MGFLMFSEGIEKDQQHEVCYRTRFTLKVPISNIKISNITSV